MATFESKCLEECYTKARINRRNPESTLGCDAPFDLIDTTVGHSKRQRLGFAFSTIGEAREAQHCIGGAVVSANGVLFGGW